MEFTQQDASIPYKYGEDKTLEEMRRYVDGTYTGHYSGKRNTQVFDLITQRGYGIPFSASAIMKYAYRYGLKGGYNRADLLKIIHYAMFMLYLHDEENSKQPT